MFKKYQNSEDISGIIIDNTTPTQESRKEWINLLENKLLAPEDFTKSSSALFSQCIQYQRKKRCSFCYGKNFTYTFHFRNCF